MNKYILDFEKPLKDIEDKIESLRKTAINTGVDVSDGIVALQDELDHYAKSLSSSNPDVFQIVDKKNKLVE